MPLVPNPSATILPLVSLKAAAAIILKVPPLPLVAADADSLELSIVILFAVMSISPPFQVVPDLASSANAVVAVLNVRLVDSVKVILPPLPVPKPFAAIVEVAPVALLRVSAVRVIVPPSPFPA